MTIQEVVALGLEVIMRVSRIVLDVKNGHISPEDALARIREAPTQDAAVDAKVDAALDSKFPEQP